METVREYPKPKVEQGKCVCPLCRADLDVQTPDNEYDDSDRRCYYECLYCEYYWVE